MSLRLSHKLCALMLGISILGATFLPDTPTYAATDCPKGSLQSGAKYKTDKSDTVASPSSITVDTDTHKVGDGTILASLAQCNMRGEDIKGSDLNNTVQTIINVIIGVLGLITVIVIIFGGVQYVTSIGDPGKVKKAKDTILYGIIGLIVALLAFAIVNYVLSNIF